MRFTFVLLAVVAGLTAWTAWAQDAQRSREVWAVDGRATADGRALSRGDAVSLGEAIATAKASRLSLFVDEVFVQLDPETQIRLETGPDGYVIVSLDKGRVRLLDTRDSGAAMRIRAGGAVATLTGGDAEVYILAEKAQRYAMFCQFDGNLVVSRNRQQLPVAPGGCVLSPPGQAPYAARGHDPQVPLPPVAAGPPPPIGPFNPPVAALGPPPGFPGPVGPDPVVRDPCDNPGSGCLGGTGVFEPAPNTAFCAPGVVCP